MPIFVYTTAVPDELKNTRGIEMMFQNGEGSIPSKRQLVWKIVLAVVLAFTVLWMLTTLVMLCAGSFKVCKKLKTIDVIDELAVDLNKCASLGRQTCVHEMKKIEPPVKLTGLMNCVGPAIGSLVHLFTDLINVYTLYDHALTHEQNRARNYRMAALIFFNMVVTLSYNTWLSGNPVSIICETWKSFSRGMVTDKYLEI